MSSFAFIIGLHYSLLLFPLNITHHTLPLEDLFVGLEREVSNLMNESCFLIAFTNTIQLNNIHPISGKGKQG